MQFAFLKPGFEDLQYVEATDTYDNVMSCLGNGLTVAQKKNEKMTAHLDEVDILPIINHGPRPSVQRPALVDNIHHEADQAVDNIHLEAAQAGPSLDIA